MQKHLISCISYLPFLILLLFTTNTHAQKVLQVEKINSAKTIKFHPGDVVHFKTNDVKGWQKSVLQDVDVKNNTVEFEKGTYSLNSITVLQTQQQRFWAYYFTGQFIGYGLPMTVYAIIDWIAKGSIVNPFGITTGLAGIGLAIISYYVLRSIKYKKGRKYRFRVLDLSF